MMEMGLTILTPLLFHEEFERGDLGSIIGIEGTGLGTTGNWVHSSVNGTFQVGNGLSGSATADSNSW